MISVSVFSATETTAPEALETPEALAALAALFQAAGSQKNDTYIRKSLAAHRAGARTIYCAHWQNGEKRDAPVPAGYCVLNHAPGYALFRKTGIPEIQDLNVAPALRRKGIAKALIAHCETQARQNGAAQIGIGVGLSPPYGPAQRLYVSLGYVPDGYGVTYDRVTAAHGAFLPLDDDLSLMMVKLLDAACGVA